MPNWMVRGKTVMIPKEGCVGKAEQFRPIACLNTSYKLLTGALAGMITEHTLRVGVLPAEQKAIRKGTRECLDALTVDMAVADEAKRDKRDLSVAWVDYRKAYNLVPHQWLKAMLWAVRVPKPIRALVRQVVKMWATDLCLWTPHGPKHIPMDMKRGIYQGDSLSPLLFCLCVAPLSKALRATKGFYSTHQINPVTHLMFVDDLKVYTDGKSGLEEAVKVVENVSGAMGMEFGLRKCAVAHMIRGSEEMRGGIALGSGTELRELEEEMPTITWGWSRGLGRS